MIGIFVESSSEYVADTRVLQVSVLLMLNGYGASLVIVYTGSSRQQDARVGVCLLVSCRRLDVGPS